MSLGTRLTVTAKGGTIPDVVVMAAHPGLQSILRLGEATLRQVDRYSSDSAREEREAELGVKLSSQIKATPC